MGRSSGARSSTILGFILGLALAFGACGGSAGTPSPSAGHARPFTPGSLAFDAAGDLYVSDCNEGYVFKIDRTGMTTVIAGTGLLNEEGGMAGEGGPATNAELACPAEITFAPNGDLIIVDHLNNRIREVGHDGVIHTIVGSGPIGAKTGSFAGDGGPATEANLREPVSVLFDGDGNLYIGDRDNDAIRKVSPQKTITTFVGTGGAAGYAGDGGPATRAELYSPSGMAFDAAGNLYFADSRNYVIRKVDTQGIITTIAGTGIAGYSGDGGPANKAQMQPDDVAFDLAGNLYIAEPENHVVRMVDAKGIIKTVAGTGRSGCSGYGGPATNAELKVPYSPVFDRAGNLLIADEQCFVVLKVDQNGVMSVYLH